MINLETIDLIINEYYDEEMNSSKYLEYEARKANSNYINDYTNEQCFEFFKISNSIKLTKMRLSEYSNIEFEKFSKKYLNLIDFNSATFKRSNKGFCRSLLNFNRYNT